jgi:hypothetical protein
VGDTRFFAGNLFFARRMRAAPGGARPLYGSSDDIGPTAEFRFSPGPQRGHLTIVEPSQFPRTQEGSPNERRRQPPSSPGPRASSWNRSEITILSNWPSRAGNFR